MFDIYKISDGDTIESIANNFKTSIEYLCKINDIRGDRVFKNDDNLIVPKLMSSIYEYVKMDKGMGVKDFCKDNDLDVNLISYLNGCNVDDYFYKGEIIVVPKNNISFYVTGSDDTIGNVCKTMNVNVDSLIWQNDDIYLRGGQLIAIKDK